MSKTKKDTLGQYLVTMPLKVIDDITNRAIRDNVEKFVVGAVIREGNKTLLLKRVEDDFMGGLVELPSGNKDGNESLIECLIRETKEETGLDIVEITKFIDVFDYKSGSGKHARQFNFLVKCKGKEITLNPAEHSEYMWVDTTGDVNLNISKQTLEIVNNSF